jgi:ParB family chromosome partitioning protein
MFSAAQLRAFLRALVSIDPYVFHDVAEHLAANDENNQQTSEEILLSPPSTDCQMTGSPGALRLVFTAHIPIPAKAKSTF